MDYRKLNAITEADVFPLSGIDSILDKLGNAMYFTILDLAAVYYQIEIQEEDKEKTPLAIGDDLYQFDVIHFDLKSAPATFQRAIKFALIGLPFDWVYIDDIVIASNGKLADHLHHLRQLFDHLRQCHLQLMGNKCLGHVISSVQIERIWRSLTLSKNIQHRKTPET